MDALFSEVKPDKVIERFNRLKGHRATWESLWDDVGDYILPSAQGVVGQDTPGEKKNELLFTTAAVRANNFFASGLYSHLNAPPWFKLTSEVDSAWADMATRRLHEVISGSNFNMAIYELYRALGALNTCAVYIDMRPSANGTPELNFRPLYIKFYVFEEDATGRPVSLYRQLWLTPAQALSEFGRESVSEQLVRAYDAGDDSRYEFLHYIFPANGRRLAFGSCYIEVNNKRVVRYSGYYEQPFCVCRWTKEPDESYGRGPGSEILPEVKVLNKMTYTTLRAAEKVVDPPILVPDDSVFAPEDTHPGGISYYTPGSDKPEPLQTSAQIPLGMDLIMAKEKEIKEAFFNDVFLLLTSAPRGMTATEAMLRNEERLLALAPMLGRVQYELFNPLLERCLGLCVRIGRIPPPEKPLSEVKVEYVGKLAMTLKQLDARAANMTFETLAPWAQASPDVFDNFDTDKIARQLAERMGMPVSWQRDPEIVQQIRQQRMQQQMLQQANEALPEKSKEEMVDQLLNRGV